MTERVSDERLAELAEGWEHQATTLIHDCSLAGSQYAETCRNTAAALRELQRLRAGLRQIQSIADECVDRTIESTQPLQPTMGT